MSRTFTLISTIWFVMCLLNPVETLSDSKKDMEQSLEELKLLRRDLQQKTVPLLVLLKQLEGTESAASQQRVKVIKPIATIREADNAASRTLLVARLNDEFPVLEQRDQWYRLRLADGREGWIHEDVVQVFAVSLPPTPAGKKAPPPKDTRHILVLAADLIKEINARQDTAAQILSRVEETYRQLSEPERQQLLPIYNNILQERGKITEYHIYANHFYEKYAAPQEISLPAARLPKGINGQLSVQTGKSGYESQTEESLTSRDVNFNGSMRLGERSQIVASLVNRREVIQTPYGSNDIRLGYVYQQPGGLNLNSYVAYNGYDDKSLDRNTFNRKGAGFNLRYPLSTTSLLFTDFNYDNKDYKKDGGNNYRGGQLNTGLRLKTNPGTELTLALQGLVQNSEISFLDFRRFIPQVQYLRRKPEGSFGAKMELERIGYAQEAKNNNFMREQVDLLWSKNGSQRQVSVIGKQFPNNKDQGYVKLGGKMRWQDAALLNLSRTELSLLLVFFPQGRDRQIDYLDLRVDRSSSGNRFYHDLSLFGRVWRKTEAVTIRDHLVDLYGRWGLKLGQLQVGPLFGAHLLLNKDEKAFKRDGNSFRTGLDLEANFMIGQAAINMAIRYEKDFVLGNKIAIDPNTGQTTVGKLVTRRPTTAQVAAGMRIPILQDFEFRLDINQYNIETDVDEEISINPISSRSRTVIMAGFGYRFGL